MRSPPRSLLSNTLLHGSSAATSLLLFVLLVGAGRMLGPIDFGRFSFALAFVFFFDFLLDPGLYHLIIRETARNEATGRGLLERAHAWKLLLAPVVVALAALLSGLVEPAPRSMLAVGLMACSQVLRSLKEGLRAGLLGRERFGLDAISLTFERLALLVVGLMVLLAGGGLIALCLVFVVVRAVDLALLALLGRRVGLSLTPRLDRASTLDMLRVALPIGAFYVTLNIYNYVDTVMLAALRPDAEVGWYSASYRVYEGLFLLPSILGTVFMPRLSRTHRRDRPQFARLTARGCRYALLAGVALAVNLMLAASALVATTFGARFEPSVATLQLLVSGFPAVFVLHFLQPVALAMDRQRLLLVCGLSGLVLNVAFNAWLIPLYGHLGAALVTVVVEVMVLAGLGMGLRDGLAAGAWWSAFWRPLLVLVPAMGLLVWLLPRAGLLPALVLANLGLAALVLVGGLIGHDEFRAIGSWLRGLAAARESRP